MWFFESSISITESGVLQGMTDCHSHLLPSVDDGVKTEKDTFVILDEMERQGVRKVWLTPHIMEDIPNETVMLQQKFQNLRQEYREKWNCLWRQNICWMPSLRNDYNKMICFH